MRQVLTYWIQVDSSGHVAVTSASSSISEFADINPNGSATRFTAISTPCLGMVVRALRANAAYMRVGDASVSATQGVELAPGESVPIGINDVSKVYVYGTGTDKASMSYVA